MSVKKKGVCKRHCQRIRPLDKLHGAGIRITPQRRVETDYVLQRQRSTCGNRVRSIESDGKKRMLIAWQARLAQAGINCILISRIGAMIRGSTIIKGHPREGEGIIGRKSKGGVSNKEKNQDQAGREMVHD